MLLRRALVGSVVGLLVMGSQADAQTIVGHVSEEGTLAPVAEAVVILRDSLGAELETHGTNEDGRFEIDVTPGFYQLEVRRLGYYPVETLVFRVPVDAGDLEITILAQTSQVLLDPVTVEGERLSASELVRLQDFYEHQQLGFGAFITPEYIRQRHPSRLTDLLREIAGVRVLCTGSGFATSDCAVTMTRQPISVQGVFTARYRRGEGAECPVSYYIDGAKYNVGERGIDELPVTTVLAIEVYRGASETPVQFLDSDSRCGVIAIWTGQDW